MNNSEECSVLLDQKEAISLLFLCVAGLLIFSTILTCKNQKPPTSPTSPSPATTTSIAAYSQSDLTGNWTGTAKRSSGLSIPSIVSSGLMLKMAGFPPRCYVSIPKPDLVSF